MCVCFVDVCTSLCACVCADEHCMTHCESAAPRHVGLQHSDRDSFDKSAFVLAAHGLIPAQFGFIVRIGEERTGG